MSEIHIVAQLPPPVNGLTMVTERMSSVLLANGFRVCLENTSSAAGLGTARRHVSRIFRSLRAMSSMSESIHKSSRTLYMTCDGGYGILYNLIIAFVARLLKFRIFLHHHSFNYVNRKFAPFEALIFLCPSLSTHIFLCGEMQDRVIALYRKAWERRQCRSRVLSNAFAIDMPGLGVGDFDGLTIGHLSNLTAEKGALRFIEIFKAIHARRPDIRCLIAGPTEDQQVLEAIRETTRLFPESFEWLGPLYGPEKARFLSQIDAFVFPTDYPNEAQPLVLLEALAAGAAVLSTERGCIKCDHADAPGLIAPIDQFHDLAVNWLVENLTQENRIQIATAALESFRISQAKSQDSLKQLLEDFRGVA